MLQLNEIPIKSSRKFPPDIPTSNPTNLQKAKKTYSANFNSRKQNKQQNETNLPGTSFSEVIIQIPEKDLSEKLSRKQLTKEIERLNKENEAIIDKFNELEDLSVKRILRLKEKVNSLHESNDEIIQQSEYVKRKYEDLMKLYDNVRNQLELSKICKNCQELNIKVKKLHEENNVLRNKNNDVVNDLDMLKTVIFRLNVQLERYQEKLTKNKLNIEKFSINIESQKSSSTQFKEGEIISGLVDDHQYHRHTPISWGSVNSHTLGPLLDAYEDTINEKENIIESYELEMAKFTGEMKEIIQENEEAHKKLVEDENCSKKLKEQLDSIQKELKLIQNQNEALIKKCTLKQEKIEEILKIYENKVDLMKRDYQVMHDEYVKLRTENASLKEKIRSLIDSQDEFRNERQNYIPLSVHSASVNECKKWYEELKRQYENEKLKLKENVEEKAKTISELIETNHSMKVSKEKLEKEMLQIAKQLKKSESKELDLEHTLNEIQLSRSACRKQLHKTMCFAKDMVAEQETLLKALTQRNVENKMVKKIGTEMAHKMDELKNQLKEVQKSAWQEFSTVELKILEQAAIIDTMKEEHNEEVEKLQAIIKQQENQLSKQATRFNHSNAINPYQMFKEKYK